MKNQLTIQNQELSIKEYKGQRVVTFADIERVHTRKFGTAKKNFQNNKDKFILGTDYFEISKNDVGENFSLTYGFNKKAPKGIVLTESGYLMIVKSFTDDLSWTVQRELVNLYFKVKAVVQTEVADDYKIRNLNVKEMNARSRQAQTLVRLAQLTKNATCREALIAQAANTASGKELLELPKLAGKTYTAEEIGNRLGVSKQKIGRLSNLHNLKTDEYGGWFANFVPPKGEVPTFRYYENAIDKFRALLNAEAVS